jgi:hypothetical protein
MDGVYRYISGLHLDTQKIESARFNIPVSGIPGIPLLALPFGGLLRKDLLFGLISLADIRVFESF